MVHTTPRTPDFHDHDWNPIVAATLADGFVAVSWNDGTTWRAYSLWLAENADGYGLEPSSRESTLEPRDLPAADDLIDAAVDRDGGLVLRWIDGRAATVHPGWLRYVADGGLASDAALPEPCAWTALDLAEPPTIDGSDIVGNDDLLTAWLTNLVRYGWCRLGDTPADPGFLEELMARVGPMRGSNFGAVWSVVAKHEPDSTANTGFDLGQHTDLPTRETPPGFQFLHCVANTVGGGWSRMSDGLAVVDAIRTEHPDAYDALTTLDWVFMNRSPEAEHRWIGPIIDHGSRRQPLTLRAFYPVRSAPHMPDADVPRAYEALRVFAEVARDRRFQVATPFRPGDLVGFDNRRVLHGRDAFDEAGERHLRGCYMDHDDLFSRLRVLRRRSTRSSAEVPA